MEKNRVERERLSRCRNHCGSGRMILSCFGGGSEGERAVTGQCGCRSAGRCGGSRLGPLLSQRKGSKGQGGRASNAAGAMQASL